ncbi:hypothetical protein [Dactylosporangium sp. CS-033363]|uniref:hypothetical protein n=1 Tax=Dactylosporangium sp. CS-033363 TaxID=3239935 RepID=UPI003D93F110
MAGVAVQVAVTETPVKTLSTAAGTRRNVAVRVLGATDKNVYISSAANVSATSGFAIKAGDAPLVISLGENESLYGICATGETATVCVLPL